jgi:hypothetical protein
MNDDLLDAVLQGLLLVALLLTLGFIGGVA